MISHRNQFLSNAARLYAVVGDRVPPWTPNIQRDADHALKGEIYREADGTYTQFGFENVDWTCEKTNNPEVLRMYVLRFHVLLPLASTYRKTNDDRYALAARRYIESFLRDHPTREGWTPNPKYDVATQFDLRVGNAECPGWLGTLHAFLPSTVFDDDFFNQIIAAARAHLIYLSGHIFPDRNIRATHGDVLLTNSIRLSFLPEATAWQKQGVRILNDAVQRQIFPDGSHMEGVPLYHRVVQGLMTYIWKLAHAMPELGLDVPTEKIAAMHDYAVATMRPDGAQTSIGDTLYLAAVGDYGSSDIDERAKFRKAALLSEEMPPSCQHYRDANQVFLRDKWDRDATYITFDASTRRSFHWHPGRNTIQLYANRRALLIDTGYPFKTAEYPYYGKRTAHHSTITLNGWNQSQSIAQLQWHNAPGYDLVKGYYDGGYWPMPDWSHGTGLWGEHHRTLLWIRGRCIVVLDHIHTSSEENRKPSLEAAWQFSEGEVIVEPESRRARTNHPDSNLLMLFAITPDNTQFSVHSGERDPMLGWIPIQWGKKCIPAPLLRQVVPAYHPWNANFATVLVPYAGTSVPKVEINAEAPDIGLGGPPAGRMELRWGDDSIDRIIWTPRLEYAINQQHGIDSDASLVHLHYTDKTKLAGGLVAEGRFLDVEDSNGKMQSRISDVVVIKAT